MDGQTFQETPEMVLVLAGDELSVDIPAHETPTSGGFDITTFLESHGAKMTVGHDGQPITVAEAYYGCDGFQRLVHAFGERAIHMIAAPKLVEEEPEEKEKARGEISQVEKIQKKAERPKPNAQQAPATFEQVAVPTKERPNGHNSPRHETTIVQSTADKLGSFEGGEIGNFAAASPSLSGRSAKIEKPAPAREFATDVTDTPVAESSLSSHENTGGTVGSSGWSKSDERTAEAWPPAPAKVETTNDSVQYQIPGTESTPRPAAIIEVGVVEDTYNSQANVPKDEDEIEAQQTVMERIAIADEGETFKIPHVEIVENEIPVGPEVVEPSDLSGGVMEAFELAVPAESRLEQGVVATAEPAEFGLAKELVMFELLEMDPVTILESENPTAVIEGTYELSVPLEEAEEAFEELAQLLESLDEKATQLANQTLNEINLKTAEVIALDEGREEQPEIITKSKEAKDELTDLFVDMFNQVGQEPAPELVESCVSLMLRGEFPELLADIDVIESEAAAAPHEDGTHEVIKQLLSAIAAIKQTLSQAYLLGKSALQLCAWQLNAVLA